MKDSGEHVCSGAGLVLGFFGSTGIYVRGMINGITMAVTKRTAILAHNRLTRTAFSLIKPAGKSTGESV